jgi:hypothetical protein
MDAARTGPMATRCPEHGGSTVSRVRGDAVAAGTRLSDRFVFHSQRSGERTITPTAASTENYVSVDAGVLMRRHRDRRAVCRQQHLLPADQQGAHWQVSSIGRRLALTVGLTISSVADENNKTRSDLFWNQSMVLGGGYRLASSVRGGAGALLFRQSDPNPLITRKSPAVTWYVSFSFDLDLLRGFAG